jgi:hypothetical protein
MKTGLDRDAEVYELHRREWARAQQGKFVLIHNGAIDDFYPDYSSALREGLRRFGVNAQFLIKQVCATEPVFLVY